MFGFKIIKVYHGYMIVRPMRKFGIKNANHYKILSTTT